MPAPRVAYTGVRFGEAVALRVGRLDLLSRRLEVAESVTAGQRRTGVATPQGPCTTVDRSAAFIAEMLGSHVAGKSADQLVFESRQ